MDAIGFGLAMALLLLTFAAFWAAVQRIGDALGAACGAVTPAILGGLRAWDGLAGDGTAPPVGEPGARDAATGGGTLEHDVTGGGPDVEPPGGGYVAHPTRVRPRDRHAAT